MSDWTLENELRKITAKGKIPEALTSLGLIGDADVPYRILVIEGWRRGGSETYLYDFGIQTPEGFRRYLIKACTPSVIPGSNVEAILSEWLDRRSILSRNGIETPKLFYAGEGIIVEEYIPMLLEEILELSVHRTKLLRELAKLAAVLDFLCFSPNEPFGDLRSRGTDLVVVDFGFDLGPSAVLSHEAGHAFSKLLSWLKRRQPFLETAELAALEEEYRLVLERRPS